MQRRQEEKKQQIMADLNTSPFFETIESGSALTSAIFDFRDDDGENRGSLGFMDLLSLQAFPQSFFDVTAPPSLQSPAMALPQESSEKANLPASSNNSSISSSSTDADPSMPTLPIASQFETVDEESPDNMIGSNLNEGKKKGLKRQREPRFAFMTKSEVDHLEDGYRWRKYGQKAVKNSPFPRGYYRCTSAHCGVKKRVERSFLDPRVVVTTYEGKHTHPIPFMPRVTPHIHLSFPPVLSGLHGVQPHHPMFTTTQLFSSQPWNLLQFIPHSSNSQPSAADVPPTMDDGRRYCKPIGRLGFRDRGLLQDLIPSELMKKELRE